MSKKKPYKHPDIPVEARPITVTLWVVQDEDNSHYHDLYAPNGVELGHYAEELGIHMEAQ